MSTPKICVGGFYVLKECDKAKDRELYIVHVEAASRHGVRYYPNGGGFCTTMKPEAFLEKYRIASDADQDRYSAFKERLFYWEWNESSPETHDAAPNKSVWCWPGYCTDQRWNGWPVPYFTKTVFKAYFKHYPHDLLGVTWYDDDCFWYDDNVQEVVKAMRTTLPDDTQIYGIDGWCWNEIGPYDDLSQAKMLMPWHEAVDTEPLHKDKKPKAITQIRVDLAHEFQAWRNRHSIAHTFERPYDAALHLFKNMKDLHLFERQYINNWLYRWEHCDDS